MTGELFGAIARDTILSYAVAGAEEAEDAGAFKSAVLAAFESPPRAANLLFQVRSRQLLFGGTPAAARETISGTLIGLELAAGLAADARGKAVTLVASGRLERLYRAALETLSVAVRPVDADDAVRHGLSIAAHAIWMTKDLNA
jgi:2-dehydro-3-deoxygalactonokinase